MTRAPISYRSERKALWRKMNKERPSGASPISWEEFNTSVMDEMRTQGYFLRGAEKLVRQSKIIERIEDEKRRRM
jgi:hypothetical protein